MAGHVGGTGRLFVGGVLELEADNTLYYADWLVWPLATVLDARYRDVTSYDIYLLPVVSSVYASATSVGTDTSCDIVTPLLSADVRPPVVDITGTTATLTASVVCAASSSVTGLVLVSLNSAAVAAVTSAGEYSTGVGHVYASVDFSAAKQVEAGQAMKLVYTVDLT